MSETLPVRALHLGNHRVHRYWNIAARIVVILPTFIGCGFGQATSTPSIEFTQVPPKNPGGPLTMGVITGRVNGPHEGLKLVLYARSGRDHEWYVQPYFHQPFTTIQPDSSWNSATHLGTEYAAFLVEQGYAPPKVTEILPSVGRGVVAAAITAGTPPVWEKWWFRVLVLVVAISAILAFYRWRMRELTRQLNLRFEERLAERTRIAQAIHDTLLQGFLSASMQLHILTDQLPPGSPPKEPLVQILKLMGKVIDEGRNAVRGLSLSFDNPYDLEKAFSRLPEELAASYQTDFRIVVEGSSRTLHPMIRDEVYRIGREAISNAFRHSGADQIRVQLEYGDRDLRVLIRDNGRGIDSHLGLEGHFGLSGMRDRAQNIGAKLKVWSSAGAGTEVRLSVPGRIAFGPEIPSNLSRWLSRMYLRRSHLD